MKSNTSEGEYQMQVMNGGEFDDTSVLIGQSGETMNFGVSDDPMLMSMLSTGLYANPLRTMLQEIMFNAWDAHRMGDCQDRPIDIYLNDTSGLIVRDYGPGIEPKMMHPIYCIYGNSTKRDDKNQTGGFGLGSKSPFAYTDSFMVTSMNQGKKWMYVVKRASEENNGGPGMTAIIRDAPTDETGLMVTVPMKTERDLERSYEYIKDVLFLSGIKANIHYEDKPVETIEAETLATGAYINSNKHNGIWAVYGGVRYKIEEDDAYSEEYHFIHKLIPSLGAFFIGFAPDTLTPLPNREGLNLSERSVESIKNRLETMQEGFQNICKPALRVAMDYSMDYLESTGIQPHFLAYRWKTLGSSSLSEITDIHKINDLAEATQPDDVSDVLWYSMLLMAFKNTDTMRNLVGRREFYRMRGIVFVKKFPKFKRFLNYLTEGTAQHYRYDDSFGEHTFPEWVLEMNHLLRKVRQETEQDVDLRVSVGGAFNIVTGLRGGRKVQPRNMEWRAKEAVTKQLAMGRQIKMPTRPVMDRLWNQKTGEEIKGLMLKGHIIVAKTVTALNDTSFNFQKYFAPGHQAQNQYHNVFHYKNFMWNTSVDMIPAIVVHARKDGYEKAIALLKAEGYTVIEADEPKARVKSAVVLNDDGTPRRKGPPTFPLLNLRASDWISSSAPEMEKPQAYFCCTVSVINGYDYNKPSESLLQTCLNRWPNIALLHNKQREQVIQKRKVPHLSVVIDREVDRLLADKERIRQIYLHRLARHESNLPEALMKLPEIHKLMKIPFIRTKQAEAFEKDWSFLSMIEGQSRRSSDLVMEGTKKKITDAFYECREDPFVSSVRSMCAKTHLFDRHALLSQTAGMKRGELMMFSQKIARLLRTV